MFYDHILFTDSNQKMPSLTLDTNPSMLTFHESWVPVQPANCTFKPISWNAGITSTQLLPPDFCAGLMRPIMELIQDSLLKYRNMKALYQYMLWPLSVVASALDFDLRLEMRGLIVKPNKYHKLNARLRLRPRHPPTPEGMILRSPSVDSRVAFESRS